MTSRNRILAITLTLAIANLSLGSVIFGARSSSPKKGISVVSESTQSPARASETMPQIQDDPQTGKQYSTEELEGLRSKFLELVDTLKQFSDLILPGNEEISTKLEIARKQFEQFTPNELKTLRNTLDPATMNGSLKQAREVLEEYRPALEHAQQVSMQRKKFGNTVNIGAAFPGRDGPDAVCDGLIGSGRPSAALIISTDVVYFVAAGVRAVASRGCNQIAVVVALGEGGGANGSLACIAVDAVYFVASALREKVRACDDDWAKRTADANYQRLDHLHSDLESSVANDNSNKTAIINNSNANTTTVTNAISASQTAVVNNANSNLTTVTNAISSSQTAIINNDNTNKNTIVANDNANTAMLRDLLLRTQIEADLASTDGSTLVGLFITPTAKGGYLELVRSIVVQTIANIGGANAAQANAFLAKGDSYKAAGDYKEAYKNYRLAYKKATG